MVRFIEDEGESSSDDGSGRSSDGGLAPVIPLFGGSRSGERSVASEIRPPRPAAPTHRRTPQFTEIPDDDELPAVTPSARGRGQAGRSDGDDVDPQQRLTAATDRLLRKLASRGLSVAEATDVLLSDGVSRDEAATVIADLEDRGWLSDEMLAEQLVHAALTRNKDGRRGIAQRLAKRGIAREVAEAALAEVPDDDAERALEFARTKARGMSSLDHDTALRRLTGQLARRGYPGSVAMSAARQALDEAGGARSGVRFR